MLRVIDSKHEKNKVLRTWRRRIAEVCQTSAKRSEAASRTSKGRLQPTFEGTLMNGSRTDG